MDTVGIVKELYENNAKVQIQRATSCGENCANCGGCKKTSSYTVVTNDLSANIGDTVKIELDTSKVLFASFVVYILPLIFFVIGITIGNLLCGIAFFVIMFIILRFFDKKIGGKFKGRITKIIDRKR